MHLEGFGFVCSSVCLFKNKLKFFSQNSLLNWSYVINKFLRTNSTHGREPPHLEGELAGLCRVQQQIDLTTVIGMTEYHKGMEGNWDMHSMGAKLMATYSVHVLTESSFALCPSWTNCSVHPGLYFPMYQFPIEGRDIWYRRLYSETLVRESTLDTFIFTTSPRPMQITVVVAAKLLLRPYCHATWPLHIAKAQKEERLRASDGCSHCQTFRSDACSQFKHSEM